MNMRLAQMLPTGARSHKAVSATEHRVRNLLGSEPTGHDWYHADRVRCTALALARHEGADPLIVELAALLHDVEDRKFSGSEDAGPTFARQHLSDLGISSPIRESVAEIIAHMAFKGALVPDADLSLEGRCVRDADRLDALGAVGIARTFAYGGYIGRPIYDPETRPTPHDSASAYHSNRGTTINHFHEKLLLLEDRMCTDAGRRLARHRREFMETFLEQFYREWSGIDGLTDSASPGLH